MGQGGAVLFSADGGVSWVLQLDGIQAAHIAQAAAQESARQGAPAQANARMLADAERLVADGPDKPFLDLAFADAGNGFIVGAYGLAFRTQDGGQQWQSWMGQMPNPKGKHLYRIATAGQRMFVVGEQGLVLRSDNGGETFDAVETPYAGTWFGVQALRDRAVVAYGLRGNAYALTEATRQWTKVNPGSGSTLVDSLPLADGSLLLVDQQGQTYLSSSPERVDSFKPSTLNFGVPVSALTQAGDGSFVAATLMGMRRVLATPKATS